MISIGYNKCAPRFNKKSPPKAVRNLTVEGQSTAPESGWEKRYGETFIVALAVLSFLVFLSVEEL